MAVADPTVAPTAALREEDVAQLWQASPWGARLLRTTGGERIQVVYPGRRNLGPGPDFLDAIIALDGRRVRHGHVEIHTTTSAWRAHGHAADPAYHSVMLHVVWQNDGPVAGGPLRTLALAPHFPGGLPEKYAAQRLPSFQPCADLHTQRDAMTVGMLFAALGERRLRQKAARLRAAIDQDGPAQALYAGLLDALGYTQNRAPFRALSEALPWPVVAGLLGGTAGAGHGGEALFLGAAGLLPSQRGESERKGTTASRRGTTRRGPPGESPRADTAGLAPAAGEAAYVRELETRWRRFGREPALDAAAWARGGVRPANAPARRVAAAGILCARLARTGPVATCLALRTESPPQALQHAINAFTLAASASPYWAAHSDVGAPLRGGPQSLIGTERAREMLVNVILPFLVAYGEHVGDGGLADWAIDLFRRAPGGGLNRLSRAMRDDVFGLPPKYVPMTAARQQGLLHVYHAWCREKRCDTCAVGRMLAEE